MADQGGYEGFDDTDDSGYDFADADYGGSLDDGDAGYDDAGFDFDPGTADDAAGWTAAELQAHLAEVAREAVAPYLAQVGEDLHAHAQAESQRARQERVIAEADALEEKYVELQDDEFQDILLEHAAAVAQGLGAPHLANEPAFLEQLLLANREEFAADIDAAVGRVAAGGIVGSGPTEFRPFADTSAADTADQMRQTAEAVAAALGRGRFGGA